jgi:uncharacterized protein
MNMTDTQNPSALPARPVTPKSDLARPYWEAVAQGRLVLQSCSDCGKVRHYPRLLCDACYSNAVTWLPSKACGTVHSWTVAHHAFHPSFAAELPYALVTVDLEEGVRALGHWRSPTGLVNGLAHGLIIGLAVEGAFEARADTMNMVFKPRV